MDEPGKMKLIRYRAKDMRKDEPFEQDGKERDFKRRLDNLLAETKAISTPAKKPIRTSENPIAINAVQSMRKSIIMKLSSNKLPDYVFSFQASQVKIFVYYNIFKIMVKR